MLNDVKLHGRLTATPELKTTKNDKKTVSFTVAVDRNGKDAGTDFIQVVAWNKTAEFIAQYFVKGQPIIIEAQLQSRTITDKDNKTRSAIDVVANQVYFCGGKPAEQKEEPVSTPDITNEELEEYE